MTDMNNDNIRETVPDYMVDPNEDHGEVFATAKYEVSKKVLLDASMELNHDLFKWYKVNIVVFSVMTVILAVLACFYKLAVGAVFWFLCLAVIWVFRLCMNRAKLKKIASEAVKDNCIEEVSYFFYNSAINRKVTRCGEAVKDEWIRYSDISVWDESENYLYYMCTDNITLIPKQSITGDVDQVKAHLSSLAKKNDMKPDKTRIIADYGFYTSLFLWLAIISVVNSSLEMGDLHMIHLTWLIIIPIIIGIASAVLYLKKKAWLMGAFTMVCAFYLIYAVGSTFLTFLTSDPPFSYDGLFRLDNELVAELSECTGIDFPDNINVYGREYADGEGEYSDIHTIKREYKVYIRSDKDAERFEKEYLDEDFWYFSDGDGNTFGGMIPYAVSSDENPLYLFFYDINGKRMNGLIPTSEKIDMYYVTYNPETNIMWVVEYTINMEYWFPGRVN